MLELDVSRNIPFKKCLASCVAIEKPVCEISLSKSSAVTLKVKLLVPGWYGKSVPGIVAKVNLLLPDLITALVSKISISTGLVPGRDLSMSNSFLAGIVVFTLVFTG